MGIEKPKDRNVYVASVWYEGKRVARKCFPTRPQAKEWYERQRAKAYDGRIDRPKDAKPAPGCTVRALSGHWLKDLETRDRTAGTLRSYRGFLGSRILPAFGARDVSDVSAQELVRWFTAIRSKGGSATLHNRVLSTFRAMFRWGVREGLVKVDPTQGLRAHRERPETEAHFYTQAEIQKLIDATTGPAQLWLRIAFHTGLRPRELVAARWEWVDWRRRVIRVPYSKEFSAKGHSPREIPLAPELETVLHDIHGDSGPILVSRKGRRYTEAGLRIVLERQLKKSSLQLRKYDARHTFISRLAEAGVPLPEIQAIAGHVEIRTTMRYMHLASDYLERARAALGGAGLRVVR
jgi:integrase